MKYQPNVNAKCTDGCLKSRFLQKKSAQLLSVKKTASQKYNFTKKAYIFLVNAKKTMKGC